MLALDPPLGAATARRTPTAAADDRRRRRHRRLRPAAPPLRRAARPRHRRDGRAERRHRSPRPGGKVIKNVAGYDLAKLFSGSFGTLGLILSVNVRLHPLHETSVTALGAASDPAVAGRGRRRPGRARRSSSRRSTWPGRAGRGGLLARCAGRGGDAARARAAARRWREAGLTEVDVTDQDGQLWERQRAGQRSPEQALVRVAARADRAGRRPARRRRVRRARSSAGPRSARASWRLAPDAVGRLRGALPAAAPRACCSMRRRRCAPAASRGAPHGGPSLSSCAASRRASTRRAPATRACSWAGSDDGGVRRCTARPSRTIDR